MVDLKVVGKIEPPAYLDPVQCLRNIADDIESGEIAAVDAVGIVTLGSGEFNIFGGGRYGDPAMLVMMYNVATHRISHAQLGFTLED
jgi:hypothetical protein